MIAEGRVVTAPGARAVVGTEVLGTVARMAVGEKAVVVKGDVLAELRSDEVKASLKEARAHLAEAEADLSLAETESVRLGGIGAALKTKESRDAATRRDLVASQSRKDAARAGVERLEAEAAKYRIVAPIDGVVIARHVGLGETVAPASPIVTIADLSRLRVEAEVDEFDIARIAVGNKATITAESHPGKRWDGEVEEVADTIGPRQSRPEDPSRPTDAQVLPVRIRLLGPSPLKLGQRVRVEFR